MQGHQLVGEVEYVDRPGLHTDKTVADVALDQTDNSSYAWTPKTPTSGHLLDD